MLHLLAGIAIGLGEGFLITDWLHDKRRVKK